MIENSRFQGVIPPVITPLNADRSLDVDSFTAVIERLIQAGVNGLFLLGSSGEVAFATDNLRQQILEIGLKAVGGRVPVLVGVIDTQTARVIEHAKKAADLGADAIVATAPFYALGGQDEMRAHFTHLRKAVDLPLFAYDIPVCVGRKLPGELLLELGKTGILNGVKDSSGDDVNFRFLIQANEAAGHPLQLLTGHEVVVDGCYLGGADGSVPGLANVHPELYVKQWQAAQAGDWKQVKILQDQAAKLMRITAVTKGVTGFAAGIGAFKTAMQLLGIIKTNQMPLPVEALSGENVAAIRQVLVECDLL